MPTSISTEVDEPIVRRHELNSRRILIECCEQRALCKMQLIPSDVLMTARFGSFRVDEIELHILHESSSVPICPQAICCVSFPYGTSFCAFLGCLIDVRKPSLDERTVIATTPQNLTVTNLRQSFRVPVVEEAGLETTIRTADDHRIGVWTRDITEGGIEIELSSDERPALKVGISVIVELKFRGELVQRTAEVRRLHASYCALSFVRSADSGAQHHAASMRSMVLALQKLWLKSRLI